MNTTYKSHVASPFQVGPVKNTISVRNERHPVRDEIRKLCGATYNIEVSFEEDTSTLDHFRHIPGLISILCTLKRGGQVIAFGRSCAVFSRMNKYLERTISTAINGSFLSATNNATKVFDALRMSGGEGQATLNLQGDGDSILYQECEPASEKQKFYLLQLIKKNISDEEERSKWQAEVAEMSKDEASEKIQLFVSK